MARHTRKVKRDHAVHTRSTLAIASGHRKSYEIPNYIKDVLVENLGWLALAIWVITAPIALLGIVLGVHSLPLEFIGIPSSGTNVGFNVIAPIGIAVFLGLAIRPLFDRRLVGWWYVLAAASLFVINQIYLGHGISSTILFLVTIYFYLQLRRRYK